MEEQNDQQPAQPAAPASEAQPALGLTSTQAETLLKADLRNLSKKLRDGKTLSAQERTMLQSIASGGSGAALSYASNQVELAEILGVSRKTIQRARKRDGNPGTRPDGRWDVSAWREFLRLTGNCSEDGEEEDVSELQREKARNILLRNEKLEAELAILRRQWMSAETVEAMGGQLGSAIRKVVSTIHLAAPGVVGVSVPEAEARLKELEDEILSQLNLIDEAITKWRDGIEPAAEGI